MSYRWVWQHITDRRAQQTSTGPAEPRRHEHTWAYAAGCDKAEFVTELITDAVRDLADLAIESTMPATDGAELALAGLGAARIDQALHEIALTGLISGLTHARMSAFTRIPEDDLVQRVEDYHRLMTTRTRACPASSDPCCWKTRYTGCLRCGPRPRHLGGRRSAR